MGRAVRAGKVFFRGATFTGCVRTDKVNSNLDERGSRDGGRALESKGIKNS